MIGSFKFPKNEGLHSFDIKFDDSTSVVYAGQPVKGVVTVSLSGLMTIRGVRLRILGKARTSWADERLYQVPAQERVLEHVMCQADEVFFDTTLTLYGHPPYSKEASRQSNRRREALREGVYEYPFRFEIPNQCPTTFEGEHGYVRYLCCAILATPFKHDRTVKRAFTVIKSLDLNSLSLPNFGPVDEPVQSEATAPLNVGCCFLGTRRGDITMRVFLPKKGFVCGEYIPIWANVDNDSGQRIKRIRATLLQRVRYKGKNGGTATSRDRVDYRTIAHVSTKEELASGWALIWDQERIRIPPLTPSISHFCELIQVDYALVYETASIKLALPIFIGTLPLKSSMKLMKAEYDKDISLDSTRIPHQFLPMPPQLKFYPDMPPPCYCKDPDTGPVSIRERADTEYAPGQLTYEPQFPYYGWPPPVDSPVLEDEPDNLSTISESTVQE